MENVLYILAGLIGVAGFCYGWWRYPHKLSRWKRSRMSNIQFYEDRLAYSIAMCVAWGGFIAYLVAVSKILCK